MAKISKLEKAVVKAAKKEGYYSLWAMECEEALRDTWATIAECNQHRSCNGSYDRSLGWEYRSFYGCKNPYGDGRCED